jgi:hypothetical protein
MNWDAIGAMAELLGAIAVVATLAYLSVQLRQNTASVRASSARSAKRRRASAWAVGMWPGKLCIPDAGRSVFREGNGDLCVDLLEEK